MAKSYATGPLKLPPCGRGPTARLGNGFRAPLQNCATRRDARSALYGLLALVDAIRETAVRASGIELSATWCSGFGRALPKPNLRKFGLPPS
jgi:hypothetical protein